MGIAERLFRKITGTKPPEREKRVVSLTPELESQLRKQYEIMRPKSPGQGALGCSDASETVELLFPLRLQEGSFLLDSEKGPMTVPDTHAWNMDADGVVIDFTRYQYNSRLPEDERIPVETLAIIRPGEKGYDRYATIRQVMERGLLPTAA